MKDTQLVTVTYVVTYGSKKEKDRKEARFNNDDDAGDFFQKKFKAGYHVDAYKETVTTIKVVEKLS